MNQHRVHDGISVDGPGLLRGHVTGSLLWMVAVVLCCVAGKLSLSAAVASPLGQWTFAQTNLVGGKVRDLAGSLDGTILGPVTYTTEPEAVLFDGVQNHVQLSAALAPNILPRTNLTVGAWVAMRSAGQWPGLVGCLQDNGDFERGWVLGAHDSKFYFALTSDGTLNYLYAPTTFQLNRWYHVMGTYDGQLQKLYINGRLVATGTTEKGGVLYSTAPYVLGAYKDDNEFYPLDGWMREVAVYGQTFTAAEVSLDYQSQTNLFPSKIQLPPPKPSPRLGPIVRFADPTSAVVDWETAIPQATILEWGPSETLGTRVTDSVAKTAHRVTLSGLKAKSRYFLRVGLQLSGETTTSPVYDFETDFNYPLPAIGADQTPFAADDQSERYGQLAQSILDQTGIRRGYALDYGAFDGRLAWELVRRSDLQVMVASADPVVVQKIRSRLLAAGVYGSRVSAVQAPLDALPYTKNWFNLIVSSSALHGAAPQGAAAELFRVLRPSGGTVILGNPSGEPDSFPRSTEWETWLHAGIPSDAATWVSTPGKSIRGTRLPLVGGGQWTHNFADPAQTVCSQDERVLGRAMKLQWFGEPGPRGFTDRQARNPSPLVAHGVLYTQGNNRIAAQDVHNGRLYWSAEIPDLRRVNMPRDGGNWCADASSVLVAHRHSVIQFEALSGQTRRTFSIPEADSPEAFDWGYIATVDDLLYGSSVKKGSFYTKYDGSWEFWYDSTSALNEISKICSHRLFCLDKSDGATRWSYTNGVVINNTIAIGGGRIYFVDCRHPNVLGYSSGRIDSNDLWKSNSLVALDARSGVLLWEKPLAVPVTPYPVVFYLSYAGERLVLNDSTTQYNVFGFSAVDGTQMWKKTHAWNRDHHGAHLYHPVIVGKQVIVEPYVYDLFTGAMLKSGLPERGGCTTMSAAANAVHYINWDYAKGSPFIWDLDTQQRREMAGTRSSCFLSLISGEGMVLMPAASAGCACRFPIQSTISYAAP